MKKLCPECKELRSIPKERKICQGCRAFKYRLTSGEILPPTYTDTTTAAYKDPMRKVEEGYGFYGAITRTKTGSHIQCHICGFFFANLSAHIAMKHKIDTREYKSAYGLRITEGLVSPHERTRMQVRYNACARPGHLAFMTQKAHDSIRNKIARGELKPGGDQWTPQTRNEKGMCREQTIAKIVHIANLNDGVAIQKTFCDTFGYGQMNVIEHWFGSWDEAVKSAGVETYNQLRRRKYEERVLNVIDSIRCFYEEYNRTPQSSDFDSENGLPPQRTVSKLFGSLNSARREAGVPVLINKGNGVWVEDDG